MEKITIQKIGTKTMPSKFKPGDTYVITTVMDEKGRKLTAMGPWAENWKMGDVIEANIEEKKWTDRDGFEQIGLNLKNPDQKPFTPGGGGIKINPIAQSYEIAASLAPILFKDKKKVKLDDIAELAAEIKKRIEEPIAPVASTPVEAKPVPEIDVNNAETTAKDPDFDDEDDEKPF